MSKKRFSAFTLIELLVVMGILAALAGLGVQGLIIFRQTAQFQQTETDLITTINQVRNMARNSVASRQLRGSSSLPNSVVGAYALVFSQGTYNIHRCSLTSAFGGYQANCTNVEQEKVKPQSLVEVDVYPVDVEKCSILIFTRLSGDIQSMPTLINTPDNTGECIYTISHTGNDQLQRDIGIDLVNNASDVF